MYGHHIEIPGPFDRAVERVLAALKAEGFGALSDIDIQKAMKEKLGKDMPAYRILGACNPPLAHQALTAERDIGLLLPCNVVVYAADAAGRSVVAAIDPVAALALTGNDAVAPLATEVRARLERALGAVAAG